MQIIEISDSISCSIKAKALNLVDIITSYYTNPILPFAVIELVSGEKKDKLKIGIKNQAVYLNTNLLRDKDKSKVIY